MGTHMRAAASAALLAIGCACGAGASEAATLSGDRFDISYYYPTRTALYADTGTFTDPSTIAVPRDPSGNGSLGIYAIRYTFGQTVRFTEAAFDGVVFTDLTSSDIRAALFDRNTTVAGLTAADLTHTSNSISLDLSGITVQAGQVIEFGVAVSSPSTHAAKFASAALSPVPLPASAPMFGAGLLVLGAVGYAAKRKKAVAAA